jgi:hypothetical protein
MLSCGREASIRSSPVGVQVIPGKLKLYDEIVKMLEDNQDGIVYDVPDWLYHETIDGSQLLLSDES